MDELNSGWCESPPMRLKKGRWDKRVMTVLGVGTAVFGVTAGKWVCEMAGVGCPFKAGDWLGDAIGKCREAGKKVQWD